MNVLLKVFSYKFVKRANKIFFVNDFGFQWLPPPQRFGNAGASEYITFNTSDPDMPELI
jgi:hypothetical protein